MVKLICLLLYLLFAKTYDSITTQVRSGKKDKVFIVRLGETDIIHAASDMKCLVRWGYGIMNKYAPMNID